MNFPMIYITWYSTGLCTGCSIPSYSEFSIQAETREERTKSRIGVACRSPASSGNDVLIEENITNYVEEQSDIIYASQSRKWHLDGPILVDLIILPGCVVSIQPEIYWTTILSTKKIVTIKKKIRKTRRKYCKIILRVFWYCQSI